MKRRKGRMEVMEENEEWGARKKRKVSERKVTNRNEE